MQHRTCKVALFSFLSFLKGFRHSSQRDVENSSLNSNAWAYIAGALPLKKTYVTMGGGFFLLLLQ